MTKLEELKAALEAGDTVQWEYFVQTETDDGESYPFGYVRIAAHRYASSEGTTMEKAVNNTALIALAHNLMPQLLEAVRVLNDFHERAEQAGWHPDNSPMRDYQALMEKLK